MTDRTDSPESSDPPEIAEVRRLLADARHTDPMPDDVTARMDDVLARLGDETPAGTVAGSRAAPGAAEVVPIAARRRRRVAGLLVAAAAGVVGGVAVAPHLTGGGSSGSPATSAQENAGSASQGDLGNSGGAQQPKAQDSQQVKSSRIRNGRLVVRPQHFSADALHGRSLLQRRSASSSFDTAQRCTAVPRHAHALAAEYQHAPATLVYRRAEGGSQVVDLYVCGSARPIRSTTLPAP